MVTNRQIIDGEEELITENGNGSVREDRGVWYIKYHADNLTVMLKTDGKTANVKRTGEYGSDISYIKGERTSFSYRTPYGLIDMEVLTKDIRVSLCAFGGVVVLEYDLYAGSGKIENKMEIKIVGI